MQAMCPCLHSGIVPGLHLVIQCCTQDGISDKFLMPVAATKVQQSLEKVQYSSMLRIHTHVHKLQTISNHIFMPIDKYTLQQQIVAATDHLPLAYKLQRSTSMVLEWVDAIEQHGHELLKREAYNASMSATKKPNLGTQHETY
jgi:hypothetical protein